MQTCLVLVEDHHYHLFSLMVSTVAHPVVLLFVSCSIKMIVLLFTALSVVHGDRFSGYCQTLGDTVFVSLTVSGITELGPLEIECSAINPAGDDAVSETIFITGKCPQCK